MDPTPGSLWAEGRRSRAPGAPVETEASSLSNSLSAALAQRAGPCLPQGSL